ncbi:GNAT family N-acetyltransferase [Maribacter sp. MMG018]|uniref:GNAT family N-acetyltransferase n=1 Tax=Maribacter sp. MMG018 TaxID=2822688 RepID=UPI001B3987AE|nr:GNAT family N-acetyltransferase [Maribacter sp. MMG018]MBQ4913278.1 GNAT family N-acetyltransferase [Maribacter sp. MMG018]
MIRSAKLSEIKEILSMTNACRIHMESKNIFQWTTSYPSESAFTKDIERGELFVLEHENHIIGSIVISSLMDEEYEHITWLTPNSKNIYIHRLAVHPSFQGKGFAQQLMTFAEDYAIKNNFVSVRLDTFSQNKRNQKFYETRGYQKLGDVYFPQQSEHPFHCYELIV